MPGKKIILANYVYIEKLAKKKGNSRQEKKYYLLQTHTHTSIRHADSLTTVSPHALLNIVLAFLI